MRQAIDDMRNKMKILDFEQVDAKYKVVNKALEKARRATGSVPRSYLRLANDLHDFVEQHWAKKKDLSKLKAKALTSLRQTFNRYLRDENLEEEVAAYKANPDQSESEPEAAQSGSEAESGDDDDDDDVQEAKPAAKPAKAPKAPGAGSDSDSDWPSEDSDSSSDDERPTGFRWHASMFLKTEKKPKERPPKPTSPVPGQTPAAPAPGDEGDTEEEDDDVAVTRKEKVRRAQTLLGSFGGPDQECNPASVREKLLEIVAVRGRKGTSAAEQLELLRLMFHKFLESKNANDLGSKSVT